MADTRIVSQDSLEQLSRAVAGLVDDARQIQSAVSTIDRKARTLGEDITTVQAEFDAFRSFDEQQKALANAKVEVVNVRMKVKEQFGVNDDVRQYLTGILEANDVALVRQNVITNCTERVMMNAPGYWLAPCLVAISAWMADNRELADRALNEAIKRDDEKTSLLFALVCRRVGRMNASAQWLERYLAVQDPQNVERKMVTVLDAYSNGLFGPESREICALKIAGWIDELSNEPGFVETQQASWEESMFSMVPGVSYNQKYPYSAKRCTNWTELNQALNENALYQVLLDYFKGIFEKEPASTASLNSKLDDLLENYISSYDNEELPLRRKERMLELIIDERGNVQRAQNRYDSEQKALEETFDFTQLLTNAAMHADIIKASNATQRLSIALSKEWLLSAFSNIQVRIRGNIPASAQVNIEGWTSEITDGSEEEALCASSRSYFEALRDKEIAAVVQSKLDLIIPIVLAAAALFCLFGRNTRIWGFLLLVAAAGFALRWYTNKKNCEKTRANIMEHYKQLVADVEDMVRALCAERIDYIREIQSLDAVSEQTQAYLEQIEVGQYAGSGTLRMVM